MSSRRAALALPALLILLAGCGSATSTTPTGRLEVVAVLGPTCPVVSNTDTECGDKEFSDGTLVLINGTTEVPLVLDVHGRATVVLSAGEWELVGDPSVMLPTCTAVEVYVSADETTTVSIACDSGIR